MEMDNRYPPLNKVLGAIVAFIALLSSLATFTLQIRAWLRDAQTLRYVSIAPFLVFLATILWFAHKARAKNQAGWLQASRVVLLLVSCGYCFLWGTWVGPHTSGCSDYDIHITSPLTDTKVRQGVIDVIGTYRGDPPAGGIVIIVRLPGGSQNWPSSTPVQTDPILGVWKGSASLGGEPPQSYRIAVAFVGKSGRALVEYYNKIGRETGQWPAIEVLPDDIEICDEVSVVKE